MFPSRFLPDIEYQIFEWAASMFPREARHFAVVCKAAQEPVEFILYESLAFPGDTWQGNPEAANDCKFLETLEVRPAEFFATRVRNIFLARSTSVHLAKAVLAKCTGARNVVCYFKLLNLVIEPPLLLQSSALLAISFDKTILNMLAAAGAVFPNVQFLGINNDRSNGEALLPLDWLPNLHYLRILLGDIHDGSQTSLEDVEMAINTALVVKVWIYVDDDDDMEKVKSRAHELSWNGLIDMDVRSRYDYTQFGEWRYFSSLDWLL
ncbi:hypothetical protein H0H87_005896 [Tephrocybe sp. NHM501043]|nr:hypothetical protein H0H87_005896 [Tephrocybe sp. NHM501043]